MRAAATEPMIEKLVNHVVATPLNTSSICASDEPALLWADPGDWQLAPDWTLQLLGTVLCWRLILF
jgi:hypothetical protein